MSHGSLITFDHFILLKFQNDLIDKIDSFENDKCNNNASTNYEIRNFKFISFKSVKHFVLNSESISLEPVCCIGNTKCININSLTVANR